jgi:hypothetical protein
LPGSFSLKTGLDDSGGSLLGAGVNAAAAARRTDRFFELDNVVFFFAGVESGGEETGAGLEPVSVFFWKKPRMDFWFLADCEPETAFLSFAGFGVDISLPSMPRTMLAGIEE